MLVEWEVTLDCNYQCMYCSNSRNTALINPIHFETNKEKVFTFIDNLKTKYQNEELFLFGGEPFLHPFINDIIKKLNDVQMKFIIQTNFSMYNIINLINEPFQMQVSVHPNEIKNINEFLLNLNKFQESIRRIDIMYIGEKSLEIYKQILKNIKDKNKICIKPVADFHTNTVNKYLYEFNELKKSLYGRIYNFEQGERSFIWEEQQRGLNTLKGTQCIYKDKYILFDPMLNSYTCSYRENNIICPNDQCFFM